MWILKRMFTGLVYASVLGKQLLHLDQRNRDVHKIWVANSTLQARVKCEESAEIL